MMALFALLILIHSVDVNAALFDAVDRARMEKKEAEKLRRQGSYWHPTESIAYKNTVDAILALPREDWRDADRAEMENFVSLEMYRVIQPRWDMIRQIYFTFSHRWNISAVPFKLPLLDGLAGDAKLLLALVASFVAPRSYLFLYTNAYRFSDAMLLAFFDIGEIIFFYEPWQPPHEDLADLGVFWALFSGLVGNAIWHVFWFVFAYNIIGSYSNTLDDFSLRVKVFSVFANPVVIIAAWALYLFVTTRKAQKED